MRHPVSRELFAYWDTLRAGRTAPERSAIDPAAIRHLLAYTFLVEVGEGPDSAGAASFRLSGTRLNALFQRDLKSEAFAGIWDPADRLNVSTLLDSALDDRHPVVAGVLGAPPQHDAVVFELLLLPLRHHGRTRSRLLGSLASPSTPSWIGLRPIGTLRLSSFRTGLQRDRSRLGVFGVARGAVPDAAVLPDPAPRRSDSLPPVLLRLCMDGPRSFEAVSMTDPP